MICGRRLTARSGAGRTAGFAPRRMAGFNPSPVAVSVSVPGSFVDCTMTCARPLKTLRIQGDGGMTGALVSSRLTAVLKSPFDDSFERKNDDDVVAFVQRFTHVEWRLRHPVVRFGNALAVDV